MGTVTRPKSGFWGPILVLTGGFLFPLLGIGGALDVWHWRSPLPQGNALRDVTYGNAMFVAVGDQAIIQSFDGANWSNIESNGNTYLSGIAFGTNTFVAVGANGIVQTSTNGVDWTPQTSGTSKSLFRVTRGNGIFVAVGEARGATGVILASSDGLSWTNQNSGVAKDLHGVVYGSGLYVTVGARGTILTSADAVTWNAQTSGVTNELLV